MNPSRLFLFGAGLLLGVSAPAAWAASKSASDLMPPQKRQVAVDAGTRLTRPPVPAPAPVDLVTPFNPPAFDQPDPEEQKANAASGGRPTAPAAGGTAANAAPTGPLSDRDLLETIAPRIQPTGSFTFGGKPQLTFPGAKRVTIGDHFVVRYPPDGGQDYELEVTAIDRTTFTLRLRGEEITRPIKPSK